MKYGIKTTPTKDGLIVQEVITDSPDGIHQTIIRQVINTMDAQTHDALVQLGWTPPASGATLEQLASLQPHQQRVVIEKAELDEKIAKLKAFMDTPQCFALPFAETTRLARQHALMVDYSRVLGERIAAF